MKEETFVSASTKLNSKQPTLDSNQVIQYILESINKLGEATENQNVTRTHPSFLYEFFLFNLILPRELLKSLNKPVLAIRFIDFPTQNVEGAKDLQNSCIQFNLGKSCNFEMEENKLKNSLVNDPLHLMLIDVNGVSNGTMNIIASTKVDISIFSFEQFVGYNELAGEPPLPRRNLLKLFDKNGVTIGEVDISLLIRRDNLSATESKLKTTQMRTLIPEVLKQKMIEANATKEFENKNTEDLDKIFKALKIEEESQILAQTHKSAKSLKQSKAVKIEEKKTLSTLDVPGAPKTTNAKGNKSSFSGFKPETKVTPSKMKSNIKASTLVDKPNRVEVAFEIPKDKTINAHSTTQVFLDPSSKSNYTTSIKSLLDGKEPQALYFHRERKKNEHEMRLLYRQEHEKQLQEERERQAEAEELEKEKELEQRKKETPSQKNKERYELDEEHKQKPALVLLNNKNKVYIEKPREIKTEILIADPFEQKAKTDKMKHIFSNIKEEANPNKRYYNNMVVRENNKESKYYQAQKPIYEKSEKSASEEGDAENEYVNIYNKIKQKAINENDTSKGYGFGAPRFDKSKNAAVIRGSEVEAKDKLNKKPPKENGKKATQNPLLASNSQTSEYYGNDQFLSITHSQVLSINASQNGNAFSKESKDLREINQLRKELKELKEKQAKLKEMKEKNEQQIVEIKGETLNSDSVESKPVAGNPKVAAQMKKSLSSKFSAGEDGSSLLDSAYLNELYGSGEKSDLSEDAGSSLAATKNRNVNDNSIKIASKRDVHNPVLEEKDEYSNDFDSHHSKSKSKISKHSSKKKPVALKQMDDLNVSDHSDKGSDSKTPSLSDSNDSSKKISSLKIADIYAKAKAQVSELKLKQEKRLEELEYAKNQENNKKQTDLSKERKDDDDDSLSGDYKYYEDDYDDVTDGKGLSPHKELKKSIKSDLSKKLKKEKSDISKAKKLITESKDSLTGYSKFEDKQGKDNDDLNSSGENTSKLSADLKSDID